MYTEAGLLVRLGGVGMRTEDAKACWILFFHLGQSQEMLL